MKKIDYSTKTKEELIKLLEQKDNIIKENKKYGLVWNEEKIPEKVVEDCKNNLPVLEIIKDKALNSNSNNSKRNNDDINNNIDNNENIDITDNNNNRNNKYNKTINHLLIEGDNYHVLNCLNYTHKNKIDLIYIDPPYNTGNKDFIYNDNFVNKEDSYRHSKWLNFMYKRLIAAKELLKDDGVIFISIDDNEQANLKLLCDRVFGENGFIGTIPNKVRTGKNDVSFNFSQDYDWIVCYTKCKNKKKKLFKRDIERKYYKSEDYPNDEWRLNPITTQRTIKERPNSNFTMINPKNGQEFPVNPNRSWAVTKDTFIKYYKAGKIIFPGDYNFLKISSPALRVFKSEEIKKNGEDFSITSISSDLLQNNKELKSTDLMSSAGTKEIIEIFGEKIFSNPKPIKLIKLLIELSCNKNSIILDFFCGSGTTAQAVLELNAEDGGNRKCIVCTNNENGICENVTYPRIKKVMEKLDSNKLDNIINNINTDINTNNTNNNSSNNSSSNIFHYLKTALIPIKLDLNNISDKEKLDFTLKANSLIQIKEDIYNDVFVKSNWYQVFNDAIVDNNNDNNNNKDNNNNINIQNNNNSNTANINNDYTKLLSIYYRSNLNEFDNMLNYIKEILNKNNIKIKELIFYIFSINTLDKQSYDYVINYFKKYKNIKVRIEDIPEPALEVYRLLNIVANKELE